MLEEEDLFIGTIHKVHIAVERLRQFEPREGYYLAFSGGKDSIVIKRLADMAGVKYDAHYSNTTIDPPELIKFMRQNHKDVEWDNPPMAFLTRMATRGFPQRQRRWCCQEYKERGGTGRIVVTGVRWAESARRKKRRLVENCFRDTSKRYLNPIIDWVDADIWEFIKTQHIPYCKLYDEGWKRIGCLFCPMATPLHRNRELDLYPRYKKAFLRAFRRLYMNRKANGACSIARWKNGDEMFSWWISGTREKYLPDQMVMFE